MKLQKDDKINLEEESQEEIEVDAEEQQAAQEDMEVELTKPLKEQVVSNVNQ